MQWTGIIATDTSRAYIETVGGQYSCHDSWTGTLSFQVRADSTLAGSGLLKLVKLSCDFPSGQGLPDVARTYAFSVSGRQGASGFTFVLARGRPAGIIYAGLSALMNDGVCTGGPGPPIPVPFTGPSRAAGSSHLRVLMHGGCGGSENSDVLTADTTFSLSGSGS